MSLLFISSRRLSLLLLSLCVCSPALYAAQQGEGKVNMQGAIIDTPCAIATGDDLQSIILQALPVSSLQRHGQGDAQRFTIRLTNCVPARTGERTTTGMRTFRVTFDGQASDSLFSVQGKSSGVALRITDATGHIAWAGQALPEQRISPGAMQLDYYLTPVLNQQPLVAGSYFTAIRFKLDYF